MNIKPLKKDILVRYKDTNEVEQGLIHVVHDNTEDKEQYYEVVAVGNEVTEVSVGDTVMVSWTRITPPFSLDGERFGITNEKEIIAVLEDD